MCHYNQQGLFFDEDEALRNNWHVMTVSVLGGRFITPEESREESFSTAARPRKSSALSARNSRLGSLGTIAQQGAMRMASIADIEDRTNELNSFVQIFVDDK